MDFRSVFVRTLDRILVDNGLEDRQEEFRDRWKSFVFQGQAKGAFVTVREDFEESLVTVLTELGQDGDLVPYAHNVIGDMFEQLREADLFPEVPEAIAAIEEEGIPWAIVSNVDEEELKAIIANQGLMPTAAISSERVRSYKPDSAIFQAALDELGLSASQVVHVGDSPLADVVGAADAGMSALWVNRYGQHFPEDLPRPKWVLPDLGGLPALLLED
ncbi:MAG: HAD-IA family hydrolase [Thermoplasmata archaeon]|nr:HAD-IA family hydrolase [Thermoplasmata archaeon]NIS12818.1 HAD-IA family hydrolase [Thermoplasmata archaeon]NIS20720.1 HAD-IA family hydrolase [Thermoplasmata archaeon]NIT78123.1 HAD-IA family hydrolase [Thermoplasmata archaeon]NIU49793.1 HAD-IA family hydrolase [Thermoplasmata archaeon]